MLRLKHGAASSVSPIFSGPSPSRSRRQRRRQQRGQLGVFAPSAVVNVMGLLRSHGCLASHQIVFSPRLIKKWLQPSAPAKCQRPGGQH